jgi:uncharacterized protein YegL
MTIEKEEPPREVTHNILFFWRKKEQDMRGNSHRSSQAGQSRPPSSSMSKFQERVIDTEQRKYIVKSLAIRREQNEQFRSIVILLDVSKSMQPYIEEVRRGTAGIVRTLLDDDEVAVLSFSDETKTILQLDTMSENQNDINSALLMVKAEGQTALWDGIADSIDMLQREATYNSRVVIVLTDGEDNKSRRFSSQDQVIYYAKNRMHPVSIIIIGVGRGIDSKALRELALGTKGSFIEVEQSKEGVMLGLEEASTALALMDMSSRDFKK